MVALLGLLVAFAVLLQLAHTSNSSASRLPRLVWYGFLYGLPPLLGGLLLWGARWVLMACVMYGTIGLALDISTVVQVLSGPAPQPLVLTVSAVTGLTNLFLILLGGWSFLDVGQDRDRHRRGDPLP